jgi:ADP-dependent NAD(P)H-hydrate dehydratase / NAD(P)H-hydrate epimerase
MSRWLSERCHVATALEKTLRRCVWSAAWLREAEPAAAASQGIDLSQLMERAGGAAYAIFANLYAQQRHWLILIGPGNNGGDGYVIARHARAAGKAVTVLCMPHSKPLPTEATHARTAWQAAGGTEVTLEIGKPLPVPSDVDLVIDGLLGTGITGRPREHYEEVIRCINALPVPRVAIDIPSGLNAETGVAAGACVKADHTATFICLKPGLLTGEARNYVGQLHYRSLGLEEWMMAPERLQHALCRRVSIDDIEVFFAAPRPATSHKGSCGKVVLVGGDHGFGGSILMAAEACVSAGAGLTRVLTRPEYAAPLLTRCPEVMVTTINNNDVKDDIASAQPPLQLEQQLEDAFKWATTIAVGPGLGSSRFAQVVVSVAVRHAAAHPEKTLVVDADGLNVLSEQLRSKVSLPAIPRSVITPHPGEAARLLGCSIAEVETDRLEAARRLAAIFGGTCLLKGPGTVVYANTRSITQGDAAAAPALDAATVKGVPSQLASAAIVDAGNPGMASGGMGDVLTGLLTGLAAQRLHNTFDTTCAAALAHGVAADVVASFEDRGTRGLRATELIGQIPGIVNATGLARLRQKRGSL